MSLFFRKVALVASPGIENEVFTCSAQWVTLSYDDVQQQWVVDEIDSSLVGDKLQELVTLYPLPGYDWQNGLQTISEYENKFGYVFDRAAIPQ